MKVFIITEGSKHIGLGHVTRCLSLYQAFEEKGIMPEFIVNGDKAVECFLEGSKFEVFNWLKEEKRLLGILKDADIAIIDSYMANYALYENVSKLVKVPVYIDDTKRIDYPRGIVVNGTVYANDLNYPDKKGVNYLLGSQYIPIRKEFWEVPDKEIRENIEIIMITFGGDDIRNMTPSILKLLKENLPELTKKVIIGKGFKNTDQIEALQDEKTELIYYPDAEGMKRVMLEADIAISAGGQTLYELARIGVPTIGICVVENQFMNVKGLEKIGFLEFVGWHNENGLIDKINNSIEYLKNANIRKYKSDKGKEFVDGKGSLRTVNLLLFNWCKDRLCLRRATFEDALNIFNLSNDYLVRKNSFNAEKIEWEQHLRWLKEKLEDKNCIFFVIVDDLDRFYGQVRFDIAFKNEATINISLEKRIRGLGLSSLFIDKSISELLKIKSIRLVKAYIKEKNISSIRAFEKANFSFKEDLIIKGNKTKLYIRELIYGNKH